MWALRDSNPQPRDYESPALTVELKARGDAPQFGSTARSQNFIPGVAKSPDISRWEALKPPFWGTQR